MGCKEKAFHPEGVWALEQALPEEVVTEQACQSSRSIWRMLLSRGLVKGSPVNDSHGSLPT